MSSSPKRCVTTNCSPGVRNSASHARTLAGSGVPSMFRSTRSKNSAMCCLVARPQRGIFAPVRARSAPTSVMPSAASRRATRGARPASPMGHWSTCSRLNRIRGARHGNVGPPPDCIIRADISVMSITSVSAGGLYWNIVSSSFGLNWTFTNSIEIAGLLSLSSCSMR